MGRVLTDTNWVIIASHIGFCWAHIVQSISQIFRGQVISTLPADAEELQVGGSVFSPGMDLEIHENPKELR